jgi:hypothetical protein
MLQPVLFASMAITVPVLVAIGVAAYFFLNGKKLKFGMQITQPSFTTGEEVSGTISISTKKAIPADHAYLSLVAIYEERRRKPRSTAGYEEGDDEWNSYTDEAFRHEEDLAMEVPVPAGFSGDLEFSFPAPRPEQVTVRTNVGGVLQGLGIREGELPGSGFAMLTWTLEVHLEGSDVEPLTKVVPITLQ